MSKTSRDQNKKAGKGTATELLGGVAQRLFNNQAKGEQSFFFTVSTLATAAFVMGIISSIAAREIWQIVSSLTLGLLIFAMTLLLCVSDKYYVLRGKSLILITYSVIMMIQAGVGLINMSGISLVLAVLWLIAAAAIYLTLIFDQFFPNDTPVKYWLIYGGALYIIIYSIVMMIIDGASAAGVIGTLYAIFGGLSAAATVLLLLYLFDSFSFSKYMYYEIIDAGNDNADDELDIINVQDTKNTQPESANDDENEPPLRADDLDTDEDAEYLPYSAIEELEDEPANEEIPKDEIIEEEIIEEEIIEEKAFELEASEGEIPEVGVFYEESFDENISVDKHSHDEIICESFTDEISDVNYTACTDEQAEDKTDAEESSSDITEEDYIAYLAGLMKTKIAEAEAAEASDTIEENGVTEEIENTAETDTIEETQNTAKIETPNDDITPTGAEPENTTDAESSADTIPPPKKVHPNISPTELKYALFAASHNKPDNTLRVTGMSGDLFDVWVDDEMLCFLNDLDQANGGRGVRSAVIAFEDVNGLAYDKLGDGTECIVLTYNKDGQTREIRFTKDSFYNFKRVVEGAAGE